MKKYLCLLIALLLLLSACGKTTETKPAQEEAPAQSEPAAQEEAPEEEAPAQEGTPVKDEVVEPEAEPVSPYAWLGLQDMPQCRYLDLLCSNHYYQVYDSYVLGLKSEIIEAADGIDAYQLNGGTTSLTVDGMIYSITDSIQSYMEYDMTDSIAQAEENMKSAMENGTNMKGRTFNDTGVSAIPQYADEGDTAEYEYYEYVTENPGVSKVTERFFMKDGDVFAIYTLTEMGETKLETTNVIKSITGDIPAGTFDVPDLSAYTKLN